MKLRFFPLLISIAVAIFISACTENKNDPTTSSTTSITKFSLKSTKVPALNRTTFTIDNVTNTIYNVDSLPYLSDIDSLVPTIYGATLSSVHINDTLLYSGKDTLSFTQTVTLKSTATDKKSTQTYSVKVNVHQVNPDVYFWEGVKSEIYQGATTQQKAILFDNKLSLFVKTTTDIKLYQSLHGEVWTELAVTGLPFGTDLNGLVTNKGEMTLLHSPDLYSSTNGTTWTKKSTPTVVLNRLLFYMNNKLYALGTTNGTDNVIFQSEDQITWVNLGVIPEKFPVTGFGVCVDASPSGKMRAFIVGGKDNSGNLLSSVWSTENGSYWANLTAEKAWFPARESASVVQYGEGLILIGGSNGTETLTDKQWLSNDYGLTWKVANEETKLPDLCIPRFGQSVLVDQENYLYIIGGQTSTTFLRDVWKGRKNSSIPGFLN